MNINHIRTSTIAVCIAVVMCLGCGKKGEPAKTSDSSTTSATSTATTSTASTTADTAGKTGGGTKSPGPGVTSMILSSDEEGAHQTDAFKPGDKIFCVVGVDNARAGKTKVEVQWQFGNDNAMIEMDTLLIDTDGACKKAFGLTSGEGNHPAGDYTCSVTLSDAELEAQGKISFSAHGATFRVTK